VHQKIILKLKNGEFLRFDDTFACETVTRRADWGDSEELCVPHTAALSVTPYFPFPRREISFRASDVERRLSHAVNIFRLLNFACTSLHMMDVCARETLLCDVMRQVHKMVTASRKGGAVTPIVIFLLWILRAR
jgi:hypothetical protein